MTHELDKEEYEEKAALYALGALSQHEARSFERHLADGCSSCQVAALQFEQVAGMIAFESPAATPSGYLRDMLLARIEREGQGERASIKPDQSPKSGSTARSNQETITFSQKDSRSASPSGRVMIPWAIAAALAVALFGSLFAMLQAGRESESLRTQLAVAESRNRGFETDIARLKERTNELAEINDVLTSPEHREIALAGQPPSPSASAKVYWSIQNNKWVVTANLPSPPKGRVYQLWFVTAKDPLSAGLIVPDETGHGFIVASVPANIGTITAAAITLEPEGGSEKPTMPIYAMGKPG